MPLSALPKLVAAIAKASKGQGETPEVKSLWRVGEQSGLAVARARRGTNAGHARLQEHDGDGVELSDADNGALRLWLELTNLNPRPVYNPKAIVNATAVESTDIAFAITIPLFLFPRPR